jgi:hypothetical protein
VSVRVIGRACPGCGETMSAVPAVRLLNCRHCPTAVDVSRGEPQRLETARPDGPPGTGCLPFFLVRAEVAGKLLRAWVPAFRILRRELGADDVMQRLSGYDPVLVPGPVAAPCGRDLGGALELARAWLKLPELPAGWKATLTSLPCEVDGLDVHAREGGWRFAAHELWPPPLETPRPPALLPSSAIAYRFEDRAMRDARLAREKMAWARQHMP